MPFLFALIYLYLFTPHVFYFNILPRPSRPEQVTAYGGGGGEEQLNGCRENRETLPPPPKPLLLRRACATFAARRLPPSTTARARRAVCAEAVFVELASFETPSCHMQSARCCAGRVLPSGRTRPRRELDLTGAVFSGTWPRPSRAQL